MIGGNGGTGSPARPDILERMFSKIPANYLLVYRLSLTVDSQKPEIIIRYYTHHALASAPDWCVLRVGRGVA
jgi:hypothetical protein